MEVMKGSKKRRRTITRDRVRQAYLTAKSGKFCEDCRKPYDAEELSFVRRTPGPIDRAVSIIRSSVRALTDAIAECDLVCRNCFRIRLMTGDNEEKILHQIKRGPCADCGKRFSPVDMILRPREPLAGDETVAQAARKSDLLCLEHYRQRMTSTSASTSTTSDSHTASQSVSS